MVGTVRSLVTLATSAIRDLTIEVRTLRLEVVHLRDAMGTRRIDDTPSAVLRVQVEGVGKAAR